MAARCCARPRSRLKLRPPASDTRSVSLRRAPVVAAAVSVGVTVAIALLPMRSIRFAYESENIHVALETTAALVAGAAAFLLAGRAAEGARRADVLLAAGLATLALTNLAFGAIPELVPE